VEIDAIEKQQNEIFIKDTILAWTTAFAYEDLATISIGVIRQFVPSHELEGLRCMFYFLCCPHVLFNGIMRLR
jgi:hypothetical protein